MSYPEGDHRHTHLIYVVATGKRVVVVHVFIKKTQQTPASALRMALKRAKEAGLL